MNIWIIGNSHTVALRNGKKLLGEDQRNLHAFPLGSGKWAWEEFSELDDSGVKFSNEHYNKNFSNITKSSYFKADDLYGICIGGHSPRLYGNQAWRIGKPSRLATSKDRPFSMGVLDSMINYDQKYILRFFTLLKKAGVNFFVISTPPPPANYRDISKAAEREAIGFIESRARKVFVEWLADRDIDYIDMPENTCTDEGFLKPEFKLEFRFDGKRDPHHANPVYGAEVLKCVNRYLDKRIGKDQGHP